MKKSIFKVALLLATFSPILTSCDDETYHGNWIEISELNDISRANSALFVIDDKAYLVGGYGYCYVTTYFNTTWEFDTDGYTWHECDTLPCSPRKAGAAFAIDGKGYFCGGISIDGEYHADLFEFDPSRPAGSQWRQLSSDPFPGGEFYDGLGFAINGYGFVGTGINTSIGLSNVFYKFDPSKPEGSRWSKLDTPNASRRHGATVFVIGNKAYILGGRNNNYKVKSFECLDGNTEEYTIISEDLLKDYNIDILYRYNASAFALRNEGYVTCGVKFTGEVLRDTWRFTPEVNNGKGSWQLIGDFEGPSRYCASAFSTKNYGFILCGQNGAFSSSFKDDVWRFSPDEKYNWHTSR